MVSDNSPKRWAITDDGRRAVIERLLAIVASDDIRCGIAAARILVSMEAQNRIDDERSHVDGAERLKIIQRVRETRN